MYVRRRHKLDVVLVLIENLQVPLPVLLQPKILELGIKVIDAVKFMHRNDELARCATRFVLLQHLLKPFELLNGALMFALVFVNEYERIERDERQVTLWEIKRVITAFEKSTFYRIAGLHIHCLFRSVWEPYLKQFAIKPLGGLGTGTRHLIMIEQIIVT